VPVTRLLEGEKEKLLRLEDAPARARDRPGRGGEAVVDRDPRARSGIKDPRRPIGSFLFLGPDRRRQDRARRALAEFLFDTEDAMVRIDMSEYMEKHAVSRLIGAPPATSATTRAAS
jgi:ATP-dependent Clp protease ATP-binding subunit ClpB